MTSARKLTACGLAAAPEGRVEDHHRFLLGMQLERLEQVETVTTKLDLRIDEKLTPYQYQRTQLTQILVAAYHMLRDGLDYDDLGAGYLDRISVAVVKTSLVKRLERLGYRVALDPIAT